MGPTAKITTLVMKIGHLRAEVTIPKYSLLRIVLSSLGDGTDGVREVGQEAEISPQNTCLQYPA